MKTIYKYPIKVVDTQTISMPEYSTIIKAGLDTQGTMCIWALVDPNNPNEDVEFSVLRTGNTLPELYLGDYVDSFSDGSFVWHVFLSQSLTP